MHPEKSKLRAKSDQYVLSTELVFDVTRRETFQNLEEVWVKEVDTYTTIDKSVRMVIGNKIDKVRACRKDLEVVTQSSNTDNCTFPDSQEQERVVTHAEGMAFANEHNCIYFEASAKQREGVQQAYSELIDQIVETPGLLGPSQNGQILRMHTPTENQGGSSSCSC